MKRLVPVLGCLLLLVLVSTACGQRAETSPPSASHAATTLSVAGETELWGHALSPDGQWMAATQAGDLCVYPVETPDDVRCFSPRGCQVSASSIQWSPDGDRIAFTELHQDYIESDLWVLHVESGTLVDLTDDGDDRCGTERTLVSGPMDIMPVWSPDGESIAFYRSSDEGLSLYSVAADGGTPRKLLSDPNVGGASLLWTAKERFVYAPLTADTDRAGLWVLDQDSGAPERLMEADLDMGPPWLMDISAQGDVALIIYRFRASQTLYSLPSVSYCALVHLDTGNVEPLMTAAGEQGGFYGPTVAAFSPDGSKVIYSYKDAQSEEVRVAVRDLKGGQERVLLTLEQTEPFWGAHRLTWAENDTIYLPGAQLLLSIGTE